MEENVRVMTAREEESMFGSGLDCRRDGRVRVVNFASILNVGRAHALEEPKEGEMPTAEDVAFLCFTSGTTGMPKAAMINHENMVAACRGSAGTLVFPSHRTRYLSWMPCPHWA